MTTVSSDIYDLDNGHTAGETSRQRMPTPPKHLVLPLSV